MIIIVSEASASLIVKDTDGNVLFEWYPKTNKIDLKEYNEKYVK